MKKSIPQKADPQKPDVQKLIFNESGSVDRDGLGKLHDAANALRSKSGQHAMGNLSFARILVEHIRGTECKFVGAAVDEMHGKAPAQDCPAAQAESATG
jgi:hypothetical protein